MSSMIELKKDMQLYGKEIYTNDFLKAGFVSYNDENLCWYKVINHEVLCSVYILLSWRVPPLIPSLHYCAYPLYVPVAVPESSVVERDVFRWVGNIQTAHLKLEYYGIRNPRNGDLAERFFRDTDIQQSSDRRRGAELLQEIIFPEFEKIHNQEDCYALHRAYWCKKIDTFNSLTFPSAFVDEVIYMEDKELYPYCILRVQGRLNFSPEHKYAPIWQMQLDALNGIRREEYLAYLEERKRKFVKKLEKKLGIQV